MEEFEPGAMHVRVGERNGEIDDADDENVGIRRADVVLNEQPPGMLGCGRAQARVLIAR